MTLIHIPQFSTWYCFIHNELEPDREGDYHACAECGHVFRTEAELITATIRILDEIGSSTKYPTSGAEIWICPLCTHDF